MRGSSKASLDAATQALDAVLKNVDGVTLGEELFDIADMFAGTTSLCRSMTDPSRGGEQKAAVVRRILSDKTSPVALETIAGLVRMRWSEPADLPTAIHELSTTSVLSFAERLGKLDQVAEELFRLERMLDADDSLKAAFNNEKMALENRRRVVTRLLQSKVRPEVMSLARESVRNPKRESAESALNSFLERAVARQERSIAHVEAAIPLDDHQIERLGQALERLYGRTMHVNVDVVPEVLGGLRIRVGEEIIDGTMAYRVNDLNRRFAE